MGDLLSYFDNLLVICTASYEAAEQKMAQYVVLFNYFKIYARLPTFFFSIGNSIPSRNPKAATISSGFHSDSVKDRPEGTTDDSTGTGSDANGQPSSNTPSWGTLNRISNRKGLFISFEV